VREKRLRGVSLYVGEGGPARIVASEVVDADESVTYV
jgi:hypothetical protein